MYATEIRHPQLGPWVRAWVKFGLSKELSRIALACIAKSKADAYVMGYAEGCRRTNKSPPVQIIAVNSVTGHPFKWLFDITYRTQEDYIRELEGIPIRFKKKTQKGLIRELIASFDGWTQTWEDPFILHEDMTLDLIRARFHRRGVQNLDKQEVRRYLAFHNPSMTEAIWRSALDVLRVHR